MKRKLNELLIDNANTALDDNDLLNCIEVDKYRLELIKETVELFVSELKKYTKAFTIGYDLSGNDYYFITINFNVKLFCNFPNLKDVLDLSVINNIRISISRHGELSFYTKVNRGYFSKEETYSETLLHSNTPNTFIGPTTVGDLFKLVCKDNYILTDDEKIIKDIIE